MTGAGLLARPLASFVGRTEAIVEVGGLVRHHQLVTLIGAGGCGKTRLAIEVAARVQRAFADGGAFVDLAPIESPALVAGAFAVATGVHEVGGAPLVESLRDALARRELLVVVDNCERVAAACAELLVGLLPRCPRVAVLATSRSALGVPGEVAWRVPSLTLPTDDGCDVQSSEAGRLLLDRAGLARPGFTVSTTEAPVAAAICRRLDGIPLAIELAACRLRALDLAELAKGLDDRFRLLSSGPRSAPPRQRTLEASIAWSHELLSEAERVLFRRLGVFAASFTCDEAATVCSDAELPASTVPALLRTLIDASLVQLERSRHRMLETVREYARLRLVESGEEVAIRHRHLDHVLLVTAWFNHEADGPGLDAANERLEPMVDDLRGALEWALQSGRVTDGLRLAADLRLFWVARSRNQEGQRWLAALLGADTEDDVQARTRAQLARGELCFYARDAGGQARLAREALEGARRLGDGVLEAWALVLAGWADVYAHPDEARALLVAGRASAQDSGDLQLTEFASYGLGTVEATTGRFDSARAALAAGIAIARTGRQLDLQYGLGMLGYVEVLQGGLAAATALLREATSSLGGDLDRVHRDMASTFLAVALLYQGDYAGARARLDEAIATARAVGSPPTFAVLHLGLLERALGHHQAAIERVAPVLAAVEQFGPWFDVEALVCLGEVTAATGDTSTAATHWRGAMVRAERSGNLLARTVAGVGLARLAALESDTDRARTLLRGALRAAGAAGFRLGAVDALEALAVQTGDPGLLAAVDGERARIGYVRFPLDEPAYERAMAALGNDAEAPTARPGPAPFDDAIARAVRGESRPARPPLGWDSLTPAEMRVAALVAYGLSNPEIGERLLVSRRTVQAHLSHIYAKLGVAGRVELAAAWKPRTRDE